MPLHRVWECEVAKLRVVGEVNGWEWGGLKNGWGALKSKKVTVQKFHFFIIFGQLSVDEPSHVTDWRGRLGDPHVLSRSFGRPSELWLATRPVRRMTPQRRPISSGWKLTVQQQKAWANSLNRWLTDRNFGKHGARGWSVVQINQDGELKQCMGIMCFLMQKLKSSKRDQSLLDGFERVVCTCHNFLREHEHLEWVASRREGCIGPKAQEADQWIKRSERDWKLWRIWTETIRNVGHCGGKEIGNLQAEWSALSNNYRCVRCAKRIWHMKIPGACTGPKLMGMEFYPKLWKWWKAHMGGHDSHEGCFCKWRTLICCWKCSGCSRHRMGHGFVTRCRPESKSNKEHGANEEDDWSVGRDQNSSKKREKQLEKWYAKGTGHKRTNTED